MLHSMDAPQPADHPLDEVVWRALTGPHARFAEGNRRALRYPAALAPFAATADSGTAAFADLLALSRPDDRIALFTPEEVVPPESFRVERRAPVDQMVLDRADRAGPALEPLGPADVADMLALVKATEPGPFGPRTIEFGGYLGIRDSGALVAMAGERMKIDGFTEVSAVCVDPAHRGKGLAGDAVRAVSAAILARGEVPFLHVFSANAPAIALYGKLGFALRRRMHLAVLRPALGG